MSTSVGLLFAYVSWFHSHDPCISASISHVRPRVRRKLVSTALILRVVFYPRPGRVIRAAWFLQSLVAGKEVEVESKVAVSIYHVTVH